MAWVQELYTLQLSQEAVRVREMQDKCGTQVHMDIHKQLL